MTVEELYGAIGGSYAEMLKRLPAEQLVAQFVVKFLDDTACAEVVSAWRAGDEAAAFEAAHKAKGVCANLSITSLADLTSEICEALRPGNDELRASTDVDALVVRLEGMHDDVMKEISAFAAASE